MKIDQSLNVCRMTLVELLWTLIHVWLHAFMRIEQALHPNVVTQLLHNSCSFDCAHEFVNNTFIQIWWLNSHTTYACLTAHMRCEYHFHPNLATQLLYNSCSFDRAHEFVNNTFIQFWWLNSHTTHTRLTPHMSSWTTLSSNSGDSTLIQLILVWLHTWVREQHFHPNLVTQLSCNSMLVWPSTWVREQHVHPNLVTQLSYNSCLFDRAHEMWTPLSSKSGYSTKSPTSTTNSHPFPDRSRSASQREACPWLCWWRTTHTEPRHS